MTTASENVRRDPTTTRIEGGSLAPDEQKYLDSVIDEQNRKDHGVVGGHPPVAAPSEGGSGSLKIGEILAINIQVRLGGGFRFGFLFTLGAFFAALAWSAAWIFVLIALTIVFGLNGAALVHLLGR